MKRFLSLITISIFASSLVFSNVYAENSVVSTSQEETQSEPEQDTHTLTLQRIKPIKQGDEYAWEITSEPGQLASSIAVLGLGYRNPEILGEDTVMIFPQDSIDLDKICNTFNLNINARNLSNDIPISITYSQSDIENAISIVAPSSNDSDNNSIIEPRTTGKFFVTIDTNRNATTSPQVKDDDEKTAYLTVTEIAPTAFQFYHGIDAKVLRCRDNLSESPWINFSLPGKYEFDYRYGGNADEEHFIMFANGNSKSIDVAGRWTP